MEEDGWTRKDKKRRKNDKVPCRNCNSVDGCLNGQTVIHPYLEFFFVICLLTLF